MAVRHPSIAAFRGYCSTMGLRERTARTYSEYVERMLAYRSCSHSAITVDLGRRYLRQIAEERSMASSTYRIVYAALQKYFFDFLELEGDRQQDLGEKPSSNARPRPITVLSQEDVISLIGSLSKSHHRIFALMIYSTGMRLLEATMIRVEDCCWNQQRIRIREQKGGGGRWVYLEPELIKRLKQHIAAYEEPSPWLFRSGRDPAIQACPGTFQSAIKTARKHAGLPSWVTIHTLRHTFATHQLQAGLDIRSLQLLLGHAVITTTMRYLHFLDMTTGQPSEPKPLIADLTTFWRQQLRSGVQG